MEVDSYNKYLSTDILKNKSNWKEVRPLTGIVGKTKTFQVLDREGGVSYIIKQNFENKFLGGEKFKEDALKKLKLNQLLLNYTDYVGEILDVKSEEFSMKKKGPIIVTTEILMKCLGIDLMSLRQQTKVSSTDLLNVVFQSALALAIAHNQGVYHGGVSPDNILYDNGKVKLINFNISSRIESEYLLKQDYLNVEAEIKKGTQCYCPPEVLFYKSTKKHSPISLGKIDTYYWGMSMLQFLMNMSEEGLHRQTYPLKESVKECNKVLKEIKRQKIPEFKDAVSHCLMRLICRCLVYTPSTRLSMKDILACLADPDGEFGEIIKVLPADMKDAYIRQMQDVIGMPVRVHTKSVLSQEVTVDIPLSHLDSKIIVGIEKEIKKNNINLRTEIIEEIKENPCPKGSTLNTRNTLEEEKIPQREKIDTILKTALEQIEILLNVEETYDLPFFKQIVGSSDGKFKVEENDLDWGTVAAGISINSRIKTLGLEHNQIGQRGIEFIAAIIKPNSSLTSLNLEGNNIGVEGAELIAFVLQNKTPLTELNLDENDIREQGTKYIADALKSNFILLKLSLGMNFIRDKGTEFIASAVKSNSTLTELYLYENEIGDEGATLLAAALKSNLTLTTLSLFRNSLTEKGETLLDKAAAINNKCKLKFTLLTVNTKWREDKRK